MSSGSYAQTHVKCPFYVSDDDLRQITCEGITDRSTLILHFRRKAEMSQQMRIFCCDNYEHCEIFRMLKEKYD